MFPRGSLHLDLALCAVQPDGGPERRRAPQRDLSLRRRSGLCSVSADGWLPWRLCVGGGRPPDAPVRRRRASPDGGEDLFHWRVDLRSREAVNGWGPRLESALGWQVGQPPTGFGRRGSLSLTGGAGLPRLDASARWQVGRGGWNLRGARLTGGGPLWSAVIALTDRWAGDGWSPRGARLTGGAWPWMRYIYMNRSLRCRCPPSRLVGGKPEAISSIESNMVSLLGSLRSSPWFGPPRLSRSYFELVTQPPPDFSAQHSPSSGDPRLPTAAAAVPPQVRSPSSFVFFEICFLFRNLLGFGCEIGLGRTFGLLAKSVWPTSLWNPFRRRRCQACGRVWFSFARTVRFVCEIGFVRTVCFGFYFVKSLVVC